MSLTLPHRYTDLGPIGRGGMAEVRRVRDGLLRSVVAMKICLSEEDSLRQRFFDEARLTAQLHHPSIVAVHDLGSLEDGRPFFTMEEVRGRTLAQLIEVHHQRAEEDWNLHRLIQVFEKVADAVAYAHSREVIHRDLKPDNVMVGDFGEVRVMDWGLALWQGRQDPPTEDLHALDLGPSEGNRTRVGHIMGTPAYMSLEQARGRKVGPATDIYALGAILYHLLAGRPPYGGNGVDAWRALLAGPPLPLIGEEIPEPLCFIAERAMARDLYDRHAEARELAEEVRAWLEGVRRREEALKAVAGAEGLLPEVRRLRAAVERARAAADLALADVKSYDPVEKKLPGWRLEAEAAAAERRARQLELEWVLQLRATLNLDPELPEAHGRLADFYRDRLEEAEHRRDPVQAEEAEALLRVHDRGRHADWLQGDGRLSLETHPPGAEVQLFEYVEKNRRLEPIFIENLGPTPLRKVALPHGSYLLRISAPGRPVIAYPVLIERGQHWDGVAPGDTDATPIQIPEKLDEDEIFVPGGWTRLGGDPDAAEGLPPQRWWIDSFVVQRYPVTNEEYCRFLNDLVDRGEESECWAPGSLSTDAGHYHRDAKGHYYPQTDVLGRIWSPRSPVLMISWNAAMAYAAWRSARDQKAWRLLHELEWEKAARGVDRRLQPWGNHLEPTWTNVSGSRPVPPAWTVVEDYPTDESPYGVRGMAGNARDWCGNAYRRSGPPPGGGRLDWRPEAEAPLRMVRGGAWLSAPGSARLCTRYADKPDARLSPVGFRLAR